MIGIGIDSGSRTTKIAVFDANRDRFVFADYTDTGAVHTRSAKMLYEKALQALQLQPSDIDSVFVTGYGRKSAFAGKPVSEIGCHARGVRWFLPEARTIIDIGGQDSKAIAIDVNGSVIDFAMNDRCAAGTGRFLETASIILETDVENLSKLALSEKETVPVNNTCVVFAESEIIGLLTKGMKPGEIARGVFDSIARRIRGMASGLPMTEQFVFTGGTARSEGLRHYLEEVFERKFITPENPVMTGAYGAALLAIGDNKGM